MLLRIVALIWLLWATSSVFAQEAFSNGLPQKDEGAADQKIADSAWIDLRQHPAAAQRPQSAPDWVEAVNMTSATGTDGTPRTVFRIRVSRDRKSTRLNSSHSQISYAVFCLKKNNILICSTS